MPFVGPYFRLGSAIAEIHDFCAIAESIFFCKFIYVASKVSMCCNRLLSAFDFQISIHTLRPCLVHPKNQKVFKILRHIESFNKCIKH